MLEQPPGRAADADARGCRGRGGPSRFRGSGEPAAMTAAQRQQNLPSPQGPAPSARRSSKPSSKLFARSS